MRKLILLSLFLAMYLIGTGQVTTQLYDDNAFIAGSVAYGTPVPNALWSTSNWETINTPSTFGNVWTDAGAWLATNSNGHEQYLATGSTTLVTTLNTKYYVRFEFQFANYTDPVLSLTRSTYFWSCKGNTTLGSGDAINGFNNSDLMLLVSTNNGTSWSTVSQKLWAMTDDAGGLGLARHTTSQATFPYNTTNWGNTALNDPYTVTLEINNSYYDKPVNFGFYYIGKQRDDGSIQPAGVIRINDFKILRVGPQPGTYIDISQKYGTPYSKIPISQVKSSYNYTVELKNEGVSDMTSSPVKQVYVRESTDGGTSFNIVQINNIDATKLKSFDSTQMDVYTFVPRKNANGDPVAGTYTYDFHIYNQDGTAPALVSNYKYLTATSANYTNQPTLLIGGTEYTRYNPLGVTPGSIDLGNSMYNQKVGTPFEIVNADYISSINLKVASATSTPIRFKITDQTNAVTYYTSPEVLVSSADANYSIRNATNTANDSLMLAAGNYMVWVEDRSTTSTHIAVLHDNNGRLLTSRLKSDGLGSFVYVDNVSAIQTVTNRGNLAVSLNFALNQLPVPYAWTYTAGAYANGIQPYTATLDTAWVGEPYKFQLRAYDKDRDGLIFTKRTNVVPISALPTWITVGSAVMTSASIPKSPSSYYSLLSGTPAGTNTGTNQFSVYIHDGGTNGSRYTKTDSVRVDFTVIVAYRTKKSVFAAYPTSGSIPGTVQDFTTVGTDGWSKLFNSANTANAGFEISGGIAKVAETTGANIDKQYNSWLLSKAIYIPNKASADTTYSLTWEWKNDYDKNCASSGLGDNADIEVVISTDLGQTWSAPKWQDDDQTLIMSTKPVYVSDDKNLVWPYKKTEWIKSRLDLTSYKNQTVMVGFHYVGKNAGDFAVDNVVFAQETSGGKILLEADLDYKMIPYKHRAANYVGLRVINSSKYIPFTTPTYAGKFTGFTGGLDLWYGTGKSLPATLNPLDTAWISLAASGTVPNYNYERKPIGTTTLTLSYLKWVPPLTNDPVPASGTGAHPGSQTVTLTLEEYARDNQAVNSAAASSTSIVENDYSGIGNDFTLMTKDYLKGIKVNLTASDVGFTVYNKSTMAVVATITDFASVTAGTNNWVTYMFKKYLTLAAGDYTIVVNKIKDNVTPTVGLDNNVIGSEYVRTSGTKSKTVLNKGYVLMHLVISNTSPVLATNPGNYNANSFIAYENVQFSYGMSASDLESNPITFLGYNIPKFLTLTDNGNATATIGGTPTAANIGKYYYQVRVADDQLDTSNVTGYTIDVRENPAPVFTSVPVLTTKVGDTYTYTAVAKDPLNDNVTLSADLTPPTGLTFTPSTGVLTGSFASAGQYTIKLKATDANGKVAYQIFNIIVDPQIPVEQNVAPVFTSTPVTKATVGVAYSYTAVATDANANTVTYAFAAGTAKPSWLSINPTSGVLSGTPKASDAGEARVVIAASDGIAITEQLFSISVTKVNAAPVISSTAGTTVIAGNLYTYNLTATDADNDVLVFSVVSVPSWLTLVNNGGGKAVLSGIPLKENAGNNSVTIRVSDGITNTDQTFTVAVTVPVNIAPVFTVPAAQTAKVGVAYSLDIAAKDTVGTTITLGARLLPSWLTLVDLGGGKGKISGTPATMHLGDNNVTLTASDGMAVTELKFKVTVTATKGEEPTITLYPNPNNGSLSVTNTDKSMIYIYNYNGKLMGSYKGTTDLKTIDVSNLTGGTYILKLIREDGSIVNRTFTLVK